MQTIFDRIHTQFARLKENYQSDIDLSFNDGATDDDFAKLEQVLGFELPNDFKEIYRIHNGQKGDNIKFICFDNWHCIQEIINDYEMWVELYEAGDFLEDGKDMGCQPDDGVKSDFWFNSKWIPISSDIGGDGFMIDTDPTPDGVVGQVIRMWHDDELRRLIAPSLTAVFEQFATDLENDKYLISPRFGLIHQDNFYDDGTPITFGRFGD